MSDTSMDVYEVDLASQARYGLRSQALGFPLAGMVYGNRSEAEAFAARTVARHTNLISRPTTLEVDTRTDPRWLPILAELDTGDGLTVRRTADTLPTIAYSCVVVGVEHHLSSRNGWSATIHLSAIEVLEQ